MTQLLTKIIADFSTTLTTKTAVGATTGTLTSGLDGDGIQLPTATYGFTIDRNNANKEYFTATLTGANLTSIKTVTRGTGVGTSGLVKTHRKGAEVIISDWVAMKRMLDILDGTTSLDATTPIGYDGTATISTANQLATKAYVDGVAIAGGADSSTTVKGITKMSVAPASASSPIAVGDNDGRIPTQGENDALVGTSGTPGSSNKYVTNDDTSGTGTVIRKSFIKNGGNGSDGALNVTSGTTTIDLGTALYCVKNYTSINVSSGATLTFSNPHANGTIILLKSQGNVDIVGTINGKSFGAAGGAGGAIATNGSAASAVDQSHVPYSTIPTAAGGGTYGSSAGTAGGALSNPKVYPLSVYNILAKSPIYLVPGQGGGGGAGAQTTGVGGAGGRGGSALYIECAGALNFTGTINISGSDGSAGANTNGNATGASGGGGGAPGTMLILYNTLTANSGTVTNTGGTGGVGGLVTSPAGGAPSNAGGGGGGGFSGAGASGGQGVGVVGGNSSTGGGGGGTGNNSGSTVAGGTGASTLSSSYLITTNVSY